PLACIAFIDVHALCQFFTRGRSLLRQVFEEAEAVADAGQHRYGQAGGVSQHLAHECLGFCLIDSLLGCHNVPSFSTYMLFVYAVDAVVLPTVTSSMPEKGGFAIVEKYGDSVAAVRRFCMRV